MTTHAETQQSHHVQEGMEEQEMTSSSAGLQASHPDATMQRQQQEAANSSNQVRQLMALQSAANSYVGSSQPATMQRTADMENPTGTLENETSTGQSTESGTFEQEFSPAPEDASMDSDAPPVEKYVIPFDRNPKSIKGETIIFGAVFDHTTPNQYKQVWTSKGGDFDAKDSGTSDKEFAGLYKRNLYWIIDDEWDGATDTEVKLEVQKTSDNSVVKTYEWKFSEKPYFPTEITQQEGEGERNMPGVYRYKVGPDRGEDGTDDYIGHTILETFGQNTTNLKLDDIKEDYATDNGLTSDADVATHFFPTGSNNGTFTVSAGDRIADRHSGFSGHDKAAGALKEENKEFYKELPQSYEAKPGVSIGDYKIRRIRKADGSLKIKKFKV